MARRKTALLGEPGPLHKSRVESPSSRGRGAPVGLVGG